MRHELAGLLLSVSLGGLAACGGGPTRTEDDPAAKAAAEAAAKAAAEAGQKKATEGASAKAIAAFERGLTALKASPANYADAKEAFKEATTDSPRFHAGWLNLAFACERLGRYEDAVAAYRQLTALDVVDGRVALALGRSLLMSGEPDLAIVEFESVLRADEASLPARNNLAAAYLAKGDFPTALRFVKEVLAVQPKNVPAIINLGLLYLREKKLDLAQLMFEKALGYDKDNARARNNLGLTYYTKNQLPLAVLEWRRALALDPSMDEARLNVGAVYLDYLHYEAALEQFKAVRERFPNNYNAMVGEANSLFGTGDYEGAAKLYEASLAINPSNGQVLLRVGKIFEEHLSKPDRALGFYEKFVEVENPPMDAPIRATVQFLKQMKDQPPQPAGDGGESPAPAEG